MRIQEDAATGVAGADVAGYRPERPGLVDDLRNVDVLTRRLPSQIDASEGALRLRGTVVPYPTIVVCAPSDRSSAPCLAKRAGLIPAGACFEEDQSNVGDARLERSDQDLVGRVALRRRRTVRHRWMRGQPDHGNPGVRILCVGRTEAREESDRRRHAPSALTGAVK